MFVRENEVEVNAVFVGTAKTEMEARKAFLGEAVDRVKFGKSDIGSDSELADLSIAGWAVEIIIQVFC